MRVQKNLYLTKKMSKAFESLGIAETANANVHGSSTLHKYISKYFKTTHLNPEKHNKLWQGTYFISLRVTDDENL